MLVFTICSNNYLAQAIVLHESVLKHNPNVSFQIFLCDIKVPTIDYGSLNCEVIEIATIEPDILQMAKKYNIIELNTAVKPKVFEYLFDNLKTEKAIYLDPDICVFQSLSLIDDDLDTYSILLTPHILKPVPFDEKSPTENLFLNFGIYNLGFIGLKNDQNTISLLKWWKNHTYALGYIRPSHGIFVDQLPMNHAHIFFNGVKIYNHPGLNMAPWNLQERVLSVLDEELKVNNTHNLIFFHFSSHKFNVIELPQRDYNRYNLQTRPDLFKLISEYNKNLEENNFSKYASIKSVYSKIYDQEIKLLKTVEWEKIHIIKKILIKFKETVPTKLKNLLRT